MIKGLTPLSFYPYKGLLQFSDKSEDIIALQRGTLVYYNAVLNNVQAVHSRAGFKILKQQDKDVFYSQVLGQWRNIAPCEILDVVQAFYSQSLNGYLLALKVLVPFQITSHIKVGPLGLHQYETYFFTDQYPDVILKRTPYFYGLSTDNNLIKIARGDIYYTIDHNLDHEGYIGVRFSNSFDCKVFYAVALSFAFVPNNSFIAQTVQNGLGFYPFREFVSFLDVQQAVLIATGTTPLLTILKKHDVISVQGVEETYDFYNEGVRGRQDIILRKVIDSTKFVRDLLLENYENDPDELELFDNSPVSDFTKDEKQYIGKTALIVNTVHETPLMSKGNVVQITLGGKTVKAKILQVVDAKGYDYVSYTPPYVDTFPEYHEFTYKIEHPEEPDLNLWTVNPEYYKLKQRYPIFSEYIMQEGLGVEVDKDESCIVVPSNNAAGFRLVWKYIWTGKIPQGLTVKQLAERYYNLDNVPPYQDKVTLRFPNLNATTLKRVVTNVKDGEQEYMYYCKHPSAIPKTTRVQNYQKQIPASASLLRSVEHVQVVYLDLDLDTAFPPEDFGIYQPTIKTYPASHYEVSSEQLKFIAPAPFLTNVFQQNGYYYGTGYAYVDGEVTDELLLYRSIVPSYEKWYDVTRGMRYFISLETFLNKKDSVVSINYSNGLFYIVCTQQTLVWDFTSIPAGVGTVEIDAKNINSLFGVFRDVVNVGTLTQHNVFKINNYLAVFNKKGVFIFNPFNPLRLPIVEKMALQDNYLLRDLINFDEIDGTSYVVNYNGFLFVLPKRGNEMLSIQFSGNTPVFNSIFSCSFLQNSTPVSATDGEFLAVLENKVFTMKYDILEDQFYDGNQEIQYPVKFVWTGELAIPETRIWSNQYIELNCDAHSFENVTNRITITPFLEQDFTTELEIEQTAQYDVVSSEELANNFLFNKKFTRKCVPASFYLTSAGCVELVATVKYKYQINSITFWGAVTNAYR